MKMNMGGSFNVIFLFISFTTIFFFKVNSSEITFFSFSKFFPNQQDIIFQGNANTTNEKLTLTKAEPFAVGRVLYSAPIHIWDNQTGNVASFETNFTFLITGLGSNRIADGLTFFVAPVDTKPQSAGGYLGVFNSADYNRTIQTIAVEFDTSHNNPWDPTWDPNTANQHIGIDVNSIQSIVTSSWISQSGNQANVAISFTAATNTLNVSVTYPNELKYTLSGVVALKDVVPQWVRVGFSAATGSNFAAHEVLSWSFRSELSGTSSSNLVGTSSSNLVAAA